MRYNYYNEIDPFAAQWLRNLISAGHIPAGEVDERDIRDVSAEDVRGFTQCHFFAGIGVWAYALRLAGWPEDRPVWTGSCPCQPFSTVGRRAGIHDERHLWPAWFDLISKCKPPTIFGEQVASYLSYSWLDAVQTDLESEGYAVGTIILPAASVGAPHRRHRIYFVADAARKRWSWKNQSFCEKPHTIRRCTIGPSNGFWSNAEWMPCKDGKWRAIEPGTFPLADGIASRMGRLRAYGNAIVAQVAAAFVAAFMTGTQS